MRIEMIGVERNLLDEIANPALKRKDVALTYAFGLVSSERNAIDWKRVNEAIVERWSLSALKWIKTEAWRLVHEWDTAYFQVTDIAIAALSEGTDTKEPSDG